MAKPAQYFHNSLPFLYDTAVSTPQNAFLLPFIADPPTTTLQRLKGLTTGTLPTFIDAGSNFAGTAIDEDNLLMQLRENGRKMVHLGDDTWLSLFPGYFEEGLSRAYDSFNVHDLHTVDNGVIEHIIPLLKKDKREEWDIIFGHLLGVDHAGHRYGPEHPAMQAKLEQMDRFIQDVVAEIDDNTLLVVMGDHGMDSKGDHGGESDDEIEAALWMYSKKGIFGRTDPAFVTPPANAKIRPVNQIDLVPTLALLLGLPIPFNNLGRPIEEAFAGKKGTAWDNLAAALRMTAAGIKRYQSAYYTARGIDTASAAASVGKLWDQATSAVSSKNWRESYSLFSAYQQETLHICRGLWARFDVPSMLQGIFILAAGLVALVMYAKDQTTDDVEDDELDRAERILELETETRGSTDAPSAESKISKSKTSRSPVTVLALGTLLGSVVNLLFLGTDAAVFDLVMSVISSTVFGFIGLQLSSQHLSLDWLPNDVWGWLAFIFTVSQSAGFASNSYTIWEDSILLFFISTFGLVSTIYSLRKANVADRTLGVYHSVLFTALGWFSSFSRLCREEQMPYCVSTYYASSNSSTSAPWMLVLPWLIALILPFVIKSYYASTRSYEGFAPIWIGWALRFGLFGTAFFWTMDAADDGNWFPELPSGNLKSSRTVLAQTIFALALAAGTTAYGWATPCVNISTAASAVPSKTKKSTATVTILGYANAHGTRYFLLFTNLLLSSLLVQKPMGQLSLSLLTWQILSLLELLDILNLTTSSIGPIMLGVLGSFHFFKTGHQATLSSIQWESAFVPLHTIRYPYSPMLVVLNTFGPQILCTIAVPLIALWKIQPKQKPQKLMGSTGSSEEDGADEAGNGGGVTRAGSVGKVIANYLLYYVVINLATTMWAGHLRRHLMLYRIFSPRWMTGAAVLLVVDLVGIVVGLIGVRVSITSVAEVFGWN